MSTNIAKTGNDINNNVIMILNEYVKNNEYDKLFDELSRIVEYLKQNEAYIPDLLEYCVSYYWSKFNFKADCSYFIKYFSEIPLKKWKREHLSGLKPFFAMFRYEELVSDEEYIAFMNIIYTLTKPEKEHIIELKNNRMFKELKVGFISYDFGPHPVGRFILALLKNRLNFETVCYYAYDTRGLNNPIQNAIKENVSKYYDVSGYDDQKLANVVLEDEVDILIDLGGLSHNSKLNIMASRLAPIQMSYIGFPGTTGYYNIDYTIVDRITDPPEYSSSFYTEKLIYVDKTFLCYTCEPSDDMISYDPPCIINGFITIGSFCNPHKYSEKTLSLWKKIMDILPDSRFFIQSFFFKNNEDIDLQKQRFSNFGIDLGRIDFYQRDEFGNYFANYNKVDFILDTYPFNGATTTCDAFSMSVPVVSLAGHTHTSRVTASMLVNMNLPELIAYSDEEFIQKAVDLAKDIKKLTLLRRVIRDKFMHSPLTDTVSYKIELEKKFRDVYIKYMIDNMNKFNRSSYNIDSSVLVNEAITSMFYIEYILLDINSINNEMLSAILEESYHVHLMLCRFLKKAYAQNNDALQILERYNELVKILTKNPDIETLKRLINSIMKIIKMFIS